MIKKSMQSFIVRFGMALLISTIFSVIGCEKSEPEGFSSEVVEEEPDIIEGKYNYKYAKAIELITTSKKQLRQFATGRFLKNENSPLQILKYKENLKKALSNEKVKRELKSYRTSLINNENLSGPRSPLTTSSLCGYENWTPNSVQELDRLIEAMGAGYNLGNMLDQFHGDWGNPQIFYDDQRPKVYKMVDDLWDIGFRSLRIPITWFENLGASPNYPIREFYIENIEELVNYTVNKGFVVIINAHHEEFLKGEQFWNYEGESGHKLFWLWKQIAERFKHYSHNKLIFEVMNEPRPDDSWSQDNLAAQTVVNWYNQKAFDAIQSTRDFADTNNYNNLRYIMFPTAWATPSKTYIDEFTFPLQYNDDGSCSIPYARGMLSIHSYHPCKFTFIDECGGYEDKIWGNAEDKNDLANHLQNIRSIRWKYEYRPIIFGEYGAEFKDNNLSREEYMRSYSTTISNRLFRTKAFLWDNGKDNEFGLYDRWNNSWVHKSVADAISKTTTPFSWR